MLRLHQPPRTCQPQGNETAGQEPSLPDTTRKATRAARRHGQLATSRPRDHRQHGANPRLQPGSLQEAPPKKTRAQHLRPPAPAADEATLGAPAPKLPSGRGPIRLPIRPKQGGRNAPLQDAVHSGRPNVRWPTSHAHRPGKGERSDPAGRATPPGPLR
ncbi:hypothetical protein NDU88_001593 [Pleurodeles waltl]|uniref:Uncharacterized protein n=1 Tax=Pleurodeles waltl TaxID=8319 RepID=A0AAV7MV40_PLEWA|nr:hypothetical protein NDU88_001593 [Pleurodeles waltl]